MESLSMGIVFVAMF